MKQLPKRIGRAVAHFWQTRTRQDAAQGHSTGRRDQGNRTAATGGKQFDGFSELVSELIVRDAGVPDRFIFCTGRGAVTLPGFFRPTKQWDLLVVANDHLLAAVEFKALCGPSFGNNYNNRVEEALGSSTDIWTAYREGAFANSPQPFLGYVLLLEDAEGSAHGVKAAERHFPVRAEFRDVSYAVRCEWSLRKLLRERCYTATSLILSDRDSGPAGEYRHPADDLSFDRFARTMCCHVRATFELLDDSVKNP